MAQAGGGSLIRWTPKASEGGWGRSGWGVRRMKQGAVGVTAGR